jgi:hypothetical protein
MDNGERFAKRIGDLEREIRELKTAHYKTATTISTMTITQLLSFDLAIYNGWEVWSNKRAIITLTSTDGSDMVSACYVNIKPSTLDQRYWYVNRLSSEEGEAKFEVLVYSQNATDWTTLNNGGSVSLFSNVQLVGSSKFTVSVSYKNIGSGS